MLPGKMTVGVLGGAMAVSETVTCKQYLRYFSAIVHGGLVDVIGMVSRSIAAARFHRMLAAATSKYGRSYW